jgi:23S rRNA (adenine2503-C2)-methyltransferase
MIHKTQTRTGSIYYDTDKKLEWLCVGDYGKENNIKADFLGLSKKIDGVQHKEVDLADKMVITISTQKGCPMRCNFCDVPRYGYHGNATTDEMLEMLSYSILECGYNRVDRLNVHFARMGEPTFNREVLATTGILYPLLYANLPEIRDDRLPVDFSAKVVHPVISTMLPKCNTDLQSYLIDWCLLKNNVFLGEAGLQLSINSTDENQRNSGFNGMSLSLSEISAIASKLPSPRGRKYTLNFAVTQSTVLDAKVLSTLFDKDKFIVKITPIHQTENAIKNGYDVTTSYDKYDVYRQFEEPLLELGWDVIVFIPSKEEDEDRITCGNALISNSKEREYTNDAQ